MEPLDDKTVSFIESGVSTIVGTRDAHMCPECVRAFGAAVGEDRRSITMFLNAATSERTLANLRDNGQIAVTFSRIIDHQTLQAKGEAVEIRKATKKERATIERYHAAFVEQLFVVGHSRPIVQRLRFWPAMAVTFALRELYTQTPGPGAGRKMGSAA